MAITRTAKILILSPVPGKTSEVGSIGVGGGSSNKISFVPQDWSSVDQPDKLDVVDEVLLHELIHSLRQAKGLEDNAHLTPHLSILARGDGSTSQLMTGTTASSSSKYSQVYQNIEEFAGVLLTNIYRSENGRPGLVRDHVGDNELLHPLTNARNFLTAWRPEIIRLCNELPIVCDQIAGVNCQFNPIFEYYAQQNWV